MGKYEKRWIVMEEKDRGKESTLNFREGGKTIPLKNYFSSIN